MSVTGTFDAATEWSLAHPWGDLQPYVVAVRADDRPLTGLGPEYTTGQVKVTFKVATAGTLTLHGPGGGGSAPSDLTGPASVRGNTTARTATSPAVSSLQPVAANVAPGKGAVVQC